MYGHLIMENMEIDQFVIRITGYEIGMEGELRQFWNVFLKQECKVVHCSQLNLPFYPKKSF